MNIAIEFANAEQSPTHLLLKPGPKTGPSLTQYDLQHDPHPQDRNATVLVGHVPGQERRNEVAEDVQRLRN